MDKTQSSDISPASPRSAARPTDIAREHWTLNTNTLCCSWQFKILFCVFRRLCGNRPGYCKNNSNYKWQWYFTRRVRHSAIVHKVQYYHIQNKHDAIVINVTMTVQLFNKRHIRAWETCEISYVCVIPPMVLYGLKNYTFSVFHFCVYNNHVL